MWWIFSFLLLLLLLIVSHVESVRIGTLANHNPDAWKSGCGDTGSLERITCNLNVYGRAISKAKKNSGEDEDVHVPPDVLAQGPNYRADAE